MLQQNYVDLEHKEVWQTYLVMLAFLPTIFFYSILDVNRVFDILLDVINIPLIFILLWRVETLQTLVHFSIILHRFVHHKTIITFVVNY